MLQDLCEQIWDSVGHYEPKHNRFGNKTLNIAHYGVDRPSWRMTMGICGSVANDFQSTACCSWKGTGLRCPRLDGEKTPWKHGPTICPTCCLTVTGGRPLPTFCHFQSLLFSSCRKEIEASDKENIRAGICPVQPASSPVASCSNDKPSKCRKMHSVLRENAHASEHH